MKASDYIVSFLATHGVDTVFGYIGGMITHLVDSLGKDERIRYVQTYHEQTAAIAAEGYAIESGKFGVAICTSGPGVTNMMTGIADAYFGSIPVLYITGQVNTYEYKYDKPVRQQGFQEMDVISMVKPVTKYAVMVDKVENLRYELEKSLYLATSGRKGPVVIDLPMDISRSELDPDRLQSFQAPEKGSVRIDYTVIQQLLSSSTRPMLLLGAGCQGEETKVLLARFLSKTKMPIVTSLMGCGCIDETYPHYVGMIGSYGNRCANMAISKSDVLIALGTRLDTRQTGAMWKQFLSEGKIIHVDIDNQELEYHRLDNRIKVNTTVADFLSGMIENDISCPDCPEWNEWIGKLCRSYNQDKEVERFVENKEPYRLMQRLNEITLPGDVITADVGQNQMWAAQTLKMKKQMRFVTSGGLAPMGFSLPAAIGIAFANPDRRVYCINGDGGFHMAIQSLLLISQYKLNIRVIVMNNASLGMITQFQHLYFNDRMEGTTKEGGYLIPDLEALARSYGLGYSTEIADAEQPGLLIDCKIEGLTTVCPKLEYNKPLDRMTPSLSEDEYNETERTVPQSCIDKMAVRW